MNEKELLEWVGGRMFESYCIGMQQVLYKNKNELANFERHRTKTLKELKKELKDAKKQKKGDEKNGKIC